MSLWGCNIILVFPPGLNHICAALDLDVDKNDSPRMLRRHILQYVEGEGVTSREDEGMSLLLDLNDKIDEVKKRNGESKESLPQQVVQESHSVEEKDIAASNSDKGRKCFGCKCYKRKPYSYSACFPHAPTISKRSLNNWTNWRTKSKRQINLLQPGKTNP